MSTHTFLKLRQPIDETEYPHPKVFESGQEYRFPFTFVIPERLLPQSCKHARDHIHIHNAHTQLPPTLGDPMHVGSSASLLDDMSPEMCQISYMISATVSRRPVRDGELKKTLASVGKKVRVIPKFEEEPPLNIVEFDKDYCLRKEKDVKRGLMRGQSGRLVLAAAQPKPIQLRAPQGHPADDISTTATIHLRFEPVDEREPPPRLGRIWSRLNVSTFYSLTAFSDFPSAESTSTPWLRPGRGCYTETVPLSSFSVSSPLWIKHSPTTSSDVLLRRDSSQSLSSADTASLAGPSASFSGCTYYTAQVIVPISLPTTAKAFIPTFHSCLISRSYTLEVGLSYHTSSTNVLAPAIALRLPVQITTKPTAHPADSAHITQAEVDEQFFRPRAIGVLPPSAARSASSASASARPLPDIDHDVAPTGGAAAEAEAEPQSHLPAAAEHAYPIALALPSSPPAYSEFPPSLSGSSSSSLSSFSAASSQSSQSSAPELEPQLPIELNSTRQCANGRVLLVAS